MKKKYYGIIAVLLVICMTLVGTNVLAFADNDNNTKTDKESDKTKTTETTTSSDQWAKDETVYAFTDGTGKVSKTIVSDWLQNGKKADEILDATNLSKITNVKGDETFKKIANGVCWQADGKDIYYQGNSTEALPVDMNVTYFLDGQEISAAKLQGQSGRVEIRVRYTNNERYTINGETVFVPFAAVSTMIFDSKNFSNVSIDNGQVINDGNRMVAVGMGMPGLKESLGLSGTSVEIPSGFTITATAKDFNVDTMLSVITNSILNDIDINSSSSMSDIESKLNKLSDSSTQLVEGTAELYDNLSKVYTGGSQVTAGAEELNSKSIQLKDGVKKLKLSSEQLSSYLEALASGLAKIDSNSRKLDAGAKQVFESLLDTANKQITAAGLTLPELTIENYTTVLNGAIANLSDENLKAQATAQAQETVKLAVEAQRETIKAAVLQQAFGGAAYDSLPAAYQQQVDEAVEQKVTETIKATLASKDIQDQISAGVLKGQKGRASLESLKKQLDSYNEFYSGLLQYTAGVTEATTSGSKIAAGVSGKEGLVEGVDSLYGYMGQLCTGTSELSSGCQQYVGYVGALRDGAAKLKTGMQAFDKQGIQKIMTIYKGNVKGLINKLQALKNASNSYTNFSGVSSGMDGQVKFIYKTTMK